LYPEWEWEFNRSLNELNIDNKSSGKLTDIVRIEARKLKKNRFLLAIVFKNGLSPAIGEQYFSTKEFSWREDAQIIADFLNVPLQIPNVFD
jgi:hypothetical protein